jgi:hypothetical protein
VATTIGPSLPKSISKDSKNFACGGSSGVIPVDKPTVPTAENTSKRI